MTAFHIAPSDSTPLLNFDAGSNTLLLEGRLIPENAEEVFEPLNKWLDDHLKTSLSLNVLFRLYYYNTSSFKRLYGFCRHLNEYFEQGKKITVRWEYEEGDEDSRNDAEEIMGHFNYPKQFIEVTE